MLNMRASLLAGIVVLGTIPLLSCGDGNGSTTPTPVTTVVLQGSTRVGTITTSIQTGNVCDFVALLPFSTSSTGTLEAVVDWTFSTNDVDVAIARGPCTCQQAAANACETVAETTSTTAKPERVTATGQPAGSYVLAIANFGNRVESCSYQVVLTTS